MTKVKIYLITIIIFPCFIASLSCSQMRVEDQLQKVLDRGIKRYHDRGVSAAVVFSDNTIWTGTTGISHDTISIKPDMLFAIGSVTKNFVATLTLKFAEEGVLSLDDPLSNWLPGYPYIDSTITIRQLLNHTSGIYMFWENQEIWDELKKDRTKVWTPEEVLSYIKEPYFAPGDGWRYSNTNYLLLAMIIKKATGLNLSTAFRKYFWEPLGINNAFLSIEEIIPDNQAHVFGDNFNNDGSNIDLTYLPRASHESIIYGSGGLFMTAEDLARWCQTLFEGKVLQQQSMDEMLQFITFPPVSNMRAYGLGVQVYKRSDSHWKEAIGHSGGNIGTTTYMVYLPEYHASIVVMVNAFPGSSAGFITKGLIKEIVQEYR
jgi:D-alanyl-D-alanine carboxypeptidase